MQNHSDACNSTTLQQVCVYVQIPVREESGYDSQQPDSENQWKEKTAILLLSWKYFLSLEDYGIISVVVFLELSRVPA